MQSERNVGYEKKCILRRKIFSVHLVSLAEPNRLESIMFLKILVLKMVEFAPMSTFWGCRKAKIIFRLHLHL